MSDIIWFGAGQFELSSQTATVLTDPLPQRIVAGLAADVVTVSHKAELPPVLPPNAPRLLHGPGEYEVKDVFITAHALYSPDTENDGLERNVIFVFELDDLRICHLGQLTHVPKPEEVENLDSIDVLLVPIGGVETINAAKAAEVVSIIEPPLVVPMNYPLNDSETEPAAALSQFIKQMGLTQIDPLPRLRVSRGSLPPETQVVVLEAQIS